MVLTITVSYYCESFASHSLLAAAFFQGRVTFSSYAAVQRHQEKLQWYYITSRISTSAMNYDSFIRLNQLEINPETLFSHNYFIILIDHHYLDVVAGIVAATYAYFIHISRFDDSSITLHSTHYLRRHLVYRALRRFIFHRSSHFIFQQWIYQQQQIMPSSSTKPLR